MAASRRREREKSGNGSPKASASRSSRACARRSRSKRTAYRDHDRARSRKDRRERAACAHRLDPRDSRALRLRAGRAVASARRTSRARSCSAPGMPKTIEAFSVVARMRDVVPVDRRAPPRRSSPGSTTSPSPAAPTARATCRSPSRRSSPTRSSMRSKAQHVRRQAQAPSRELVAAAISSPSRRRSRSRRPGSPWARAPRRWRRRTASRARRKTRSPIAATRAPRRRGTTGVFDDEVMHVRSAAAFDTPIARGQPRAQGLDARGLREAAARCSIASTARSPPATRSPLTDGASALLLMTRVEGEGARLRRRSATCSSWAYAALDPGGQMLMGPAYATPIALDRAGLTLADIDLVDMHEAFAAQVLCNMQGVRVEAVRRREARSQRSRSARSTTSKLQRARRLDRASAIRSRRPARA